MRGIRNISLENAPSSWFDVVYLIVSIRGSQIDKPAIDYTMFKKKYVLIETHYSNSSDNYNRK